MRKLRPFPTSIKTVLTVLRYLQHPQNGMQKQILGGASFNGKALKQWFTVFDIEN